VRFSLLDDGFFDLGRNTRLFLGPCSSREVAKVNDPPKDAMLRIGRRDIKVDGRLVRVARIEGDKYCFLDEHEPASMMEDLRKCGARIDLFTFVQRITETLPKHHYPWDWDNFAALPISTFNHWWTKQLGFKGRNKAKQAGKKGITLREIPFDEFLVRGIWTIYNEYPIRQGKRFPHYGMSVERVREYAGSFLDRSVFIGAFLGDSLIGFAKLTIDETETQAGLMHIVSMVQHRDKAPTNALIAQAVRSCAERKIPYLIYSNFAYGNKQRDTLSDFKERNGFHRVDVPRYYVPLTWIGAAAFHLGMHRQLMERLPEAWIAKLRKVRGSWYARKMQSSPEIT
jgi:hypothetical protein